MGRRSTLAENPEKIESLLNYLRLGMYQNQAAAMAGIAESTFHYWKVQGEKAEARTEEDQELTAQEELELEFLEGVKKARADAEALHLANIRKAGEDTRTWQASAWWLERSFPERWGRKDRVEVTGKDEGPLIVEVEFAD